MISITHRVLFSSVLMAACLLSGAARAGQNEGASDESAPALQKLEAAAATDPSNAKLQAELSSGYAGAGRAAEAYDAITKAVRIDSNNVAYLRSRVQMANWVGRTDAAVESCERILVLAPNDADARLAMARLRQWQGRLDDSVDIYRGYVGERTNDAAALIELSQVEAWRGNFGESSRILDDYEKRFGSGESSIRQRARLLASADKPRAAMKRLSGIQESETNAYDIAFTRAISLSYNNQPREADEAAAEVAQMRPTAPEAIGLRKFVTAPQQSVLTPDARYYADSDHLDILRIGLGADLQLRPETRLRVSADYSELNARRGSGLENRDGTRNATAGHAMLGMRHIISPTLWVDGEFGGARAEDEDEVAYAATVGIRPSDSLRMSGSFDHDFVLISPRSLSLLVKRTGGSLEGQWTPDMLYTVVGTARADDYSDGNYRSEAALSPRRAVARTQWINADMGVRASWFAFDDDLTSGYYDPQRYEQYSLTSVNYVKFAPGVGLSLMGAAGYYRDNEMDDFEFGWSIDGELTMGAFSDWMAKLSGSAMDNMRQAGGAFNAYAVGASLSRRF
jgi:tetratricopeptide (TPR) repeat protein